MLDEKRLCHSKNVAKESYKLALSYGENYEKAYYAGLLHDCAKKMVERFGWQTVACTNGETVRTIEEIQKDVINFALTALEA